MHIRAQIHMHLFCANIVAYILCGVATKTMVNMYVYDVSNIHTYSW